MKPQIAVRLGAEVYRLRERMSVWARVSGTVALCRPITDSAGVIAKKTDRTSGHMTNCSM